jgi:hypothetical protein
MVEYIFIEAIGATTLSTGKEFVTIFLVFNLNFGF